MAVLVPLGHQSHVRPLPYIAKGTGGSYEAAPFLLSSRREITRLRTLERRGVFAKSRINHPHNTIVDFLANDDREDLIKNIRESLGTVAGLNAISQVDPEKAFDISADLIGVQKESYGDVQQWLTADNAEEYRENLQQVMADINKVERRERLQQMAIGNEER